MQNCYLEAAEQCERNVRTLDFVLSSLMPLVRAQQAVTYKYVKDLQDCRIDLLYLGYELKASSMAINPVKERIRELIDLAQSFRTTMVTVLVATYVPMSFVSVSTRIMHTLAVDTGISCQSLSGMNVHTSSPSSYSTNVSSNITKLTSATLVHDNQLEREFMSTDQPTAHLWSISVFLGTAVPLAFGTIVLPLVVGPFLRWLAQFVRRHRTWSRVFGVSLAFRYDVRSPMSVWNANVQHSIIIILSNVQNQYTFALVAAITTYQLVLCVWHLTFIMEL